MPIFNKCVWMWSNSRKRFCGEPGQQNNSRTKAQSPRRRRQTDGKEWGRVQSSSAAQSRSSLPSRPAPAPTSICPSEPAEQHRWTLLPHTETQPCVQLSNHYFILYYCMTTKFMTNALKVKTDQIHLYI